MRRSAESQQLQAESRRLAASQSWWLRLSGPLRIALLIVSIATGVWAGCSLFLFQRSPALLLA